MYWIPRLPFVIFFSTFYQLLFTRIEETADRAMVSQDPGNAEIYFQLIIRYLGTNRFQKKQKHGEL